MRLPPSDDPRGDRMMRLPRETLLYVLKQHGVQVECDAATSDGRQFCTLIDDEVAEAHWLPDPIGGDMVRHLARKFGIPSHAFFFDVSQDVGPPHPH